MSCLTQPQPMDAAAVERMIRSVCAQYRCLGTMPIGSSVLGRPIRAVTLGRGPQSVLMAAAFHGQEWLTALVCLRLCEEIADAVCNGRPLVGWDMRRALRERRVVWVPMVNPDGVEIALHGSAAAQRFAETVRRAGGDRPGYWQANARGVDINHNFNAGWLILQQAERKKGISGPAGRQWGGPAPESEPETEALVRLCRAVPFRAAVALHSQGEEIYWRYGERTPASSLLIAKVLSAASGYAVAEPTELASHGGFKDWFIEEFGKPGFTFELGRGRNPLPLDDFEAVYHKAREMLVISLLI